MQRLLLLLNLKLTLRPDSIMMDLHKVPVKSKNTFIHFSSYVFRFKSIQYISQFPKLQKIIPHTFVVGFIKRETLVTLFYVLFKNFWHVKLLLMSKYSLTFLQFYKCYGAKLPSFSTFTSKFQATSEKTSSP